MPNKLHRHDKNPKSYSTTYMKLQTFVNKWTVVED